MLLRLRIENYRSLRDEQELSLVAASLKEHPENLARVSGLQEEVLRMAVIYGANASGKTNVCNAMYYMAAAIVESQRRWSPGGGVPRSPFLLDPGFAEKPSLFEVDVILSGVRYQYGFVVDSRQVLEEWLYAYPNGRRQTWFTRDSQAERPIKPGKALTGTKAIEAVTRPNSLFLSAAAQNNHKMLLPIYEWFSQIRYVSPQLKSDSQLVTQEMASDHHEALLSFLRAADLGIVGVNWKKHDSQSMEDHSRQPASSTSPERSGFSGGSTDESSIRWPDDITLVHQSGKNKNGAALPIHEESSGTHTWLSLAGPLLHTLSTGGLLVVDELDASLHPKLLLEVIRIFNDPVLNPENSQLLFNTHDTNLLGAGVLRRDQIWFTEKDEEGATHLYSLADFKARQYENLERGYLQGRYGATPAIDSANFLHQAALRDG